MGFLRTVISLKKLKKLMSTSHLTSKNKTPLANPAEGRKRFIYHSHKTILSVRYEWRMNFSPKKVGNSWSNLTWWYGIINSFYAIQDMYDFKLSKWTLILILCRKGQQSARKWHVWTRYGHLLQAHSSVSFKFISVFSST